MKDRVTLCECFARDGLQHEPVFVETGEKVSLIESFADLGFTRVEATSFAHPRNVPQFTDAEDVLQRIRRRPGVHYKATCVNRRALERAIACAENGFGPDEVSIILVASDALLHKGFNRTRSEQYELAEEMIEMIAGRFQIVGTVSSALGCSIEGKVSEERVLEDVRWLHERGITFVGIADTTGTGNPRSVRRLFQQIVEAFPAVTPIAHFHDTRGAGLANCLAAYEAGVRFFDCAFGGTGGNPVKIKYAEGHTGNACTEDLVVMFEGMGIDTGLNLGSLLPTALRCEAALGRQLAGRVTRAGLGLVGEQIKNV